jgi:hypothetical protein
MTNLFDKKAKIRGVECRALAQFSTVQQDIFIEGCTIFFSPLKLLLV